MPHQTVEILSLSTEGDAPHTRKLPSEVPIAIVFDGSTQAVMMATPQDIEDFAQGFALTEGIITDPNQIASYETQPHDGGIEARFWLSGERSSALTARRRAMAGPVGCGLCGIDSLSEAIRPLPKVHATLRLPKSEVLQATESLRDGQVLHRDTRATHASGFLLPGRGVILVREDVGRHNALDKLIGALSRQGIDPASGAVVMTSRVSVELVQKCAMVGCGMLIAVSAPTALGVEVAHQTGITLIALARDGRAEIFTHADRVKL